MRLLNYQERELDDNRPFSKEDYRNRDELLDEYYRRNPSKNYKPKKNLEDSYSEKDLLSDDGKAWNKLYKEINEKSGDWYFSESRSRNFQRCIDYSENRSREINNKYERSSPNRQKEMIKLSEELDDYLAGAVLDDLGYKDTDKARRMLIRSNVLRPD